MFIYHYSGGPSSSRLLEAPMTVIDDAECKKIFANKKSVVIDSRVLCAGDLNGKRDSCQVYEKKKTVLNFLKRP